MAKLRINGDSSGYVDLEAPNAASSSTIDLDQVPQKNVANTFSANTQVITAPGSAEALHIKGRSSDDIGQIKFMGNDGIFFMPFEDYVKEFSSFVICLGI